MNTRIVVVPSALLLAACGSSGEFDRMASRGESLLEKITAAEETQVANMPTTGTATYKGVAGFSTYGYISGVESIDVLSEATLNADFASSSISGDLTNFRDDESNRIDGSVAIQSAAITDNWFDANLDGSLTYDGRTEAVSGLLEGEFRGTNAELVAGEITATVGGRSVLGVLGAERQ